MNRSRFRIFFGLLALGGGVAMTGRAQSLVYVAADQATVYEGGKMLLRAQARPGAVSVFDLDAVPMKGWHRDGVPLTVIGPPSCIVAHPRTKDILVTSAQRVDPHDRTQLISDSRVTRLRVRGDDLVVVDQLEVFEQPSGIAMDATGQRAWVALRNQGSIARIELTPELMRVAAIEKLTEPEDSLSDVKLSPDGRTLLATCHAIDMLLVLAVGDDGTLTETQRVSLPGGGYHIAFLQDGRAVVGCTRANVIAVIGRGMDGQWRQETTIETGRVPEGVAVSPDGKWIAVSCFDGGNFVVKKNPWFGHPPRVYLYSVNHGGTIVKRQSFDFEGILQSSVFASDSRRLVVGQYGPANLKVLTLESDQWVDAGVKIELPGNPAALAR